MNDIPEPKKKRQYNYSTATKVKNAAQKRLREAKKTADNKKRQLKNQKDKERYQETS